MNNGAIILATNKNTQDKAQKPFAMHEILLSPIIDLLVSAVKNSGTDDICVITDSDQVKHHINGRVVTADSVLSAEMFIRQHKDGNLLLFGCDKPFIDDKTLVSAMNHHTKKENDATVICDKTNITVGYCFKAETLINILPMMSDSISLEECIDRICNCGIYISENKNIGLCADTKMQLHRLNEIARIEILEKKIADGVYFPCYDGIIIGHGCKIGKGTKILPNTIICKNVIIGENCILGPNSYIENARIGNSVIFNNSQIRNAEIKDNANIGPFVHIRPDSVIGNNVHLGNFVEVKNSSIDSDTSVSHLTYVGDSDVGKNVNFGCGVVTVNFNGKTKNRTVIKDRAFIGCNTNLVAPVTVGENSYTAAGSTITQDVPDNSLAIARERQTNKFGWVKEKQPYRKKV